MCKKTQRCFPYPCFQQTFNDLKASVSKAEANVDLSLLSRITFKSSFGDQKPPDTPLLRHGPQLSKCNLLSRDYKDGEICGLSQNTEIFHDMF